MKIACKLGIWFAIILFSYPAAVQAQFTADNAEALMRGFNEHYLVGDGFGRVYYSAQYAIVSKQPPGFWMQAELIEAAEDAAARDHRHVPLITNLLNDFLFQHGSNWDNQTKFNDDIMWGVIAFVRGAELTKNNSYLKVAKTNFDDTWSRGMDNTNGGMWWNTSNKEKPAAVEGPAALAAYLLGDALNDASYKKKSLNLVEYMIAHYFDASKGAIYSNPIGSKRNPITAHNQGLFLMAADLNGQTHYADANATFLMTMGHSTPTSNGYNILPDYGLARVTSENNAVALRWMAVYTNAHHLQSKYLGWMQANASAAWAVRDPKRNLSWDNWYEPTTPEKTLLAWDCIASLVALQVVPPTN